MKRKKELRNEDTILDFIFNKLPKEEAELFEKSLEQDECLKELTDSIIECCLLYKAQSKDDYRNKMARSETKLTANLEQIRAGIIKKQESK